MVFSVVLRLIGEQFGEKLDESNLGDPIEFNPGLLVDVGQTWVQFFKQLFIPTYARWNMVKQGLAAPGCQISSSMGSLDCERGECVRNGKNDSVYCRRAKDPNRLKCIRSESY